MPVPDYQSLMLPILKALSDGVETSISELRARISEALVPSVDGLRCFGAGRFAHMQRAPDATAEGGGDALLAFQDPAKRGPACSLAALAQAAPDHLHELIRDHGDEQMPFGANRLVVIDRAQPEFGFQ